jgi:hypothetical protein
MLSTLIAQEAQLNPVTGKFFLIVASIVVIFLAKIQPTPRLSVMIFPD